MATATARALRENGNKAVSPGGIPRCDRSTGRGYNNREIPGAGTAPLPFQPPAARALPPARLRTGGEPRSTEQRRTGTAPDHPAPGATTTSVPTAEHREAGTTGRHEGPGGGGGRRRHRKRRPLPGAPGASKTVPPRGGEGGAGGTGLLQRISHAKPSALAGHSPEKAPRLPPRLPAASYAGCPRRRLLSPRRGAAGRRRSPSARPPSTAD